MLKHLYRTPGADLRKLVCFESRAGDVDPALLLPRPALAFIDAEHTHAAVHADWEFCRSVLTPGGTVLFHDYNIVGPAIDEICDQLRSQGVPHLSSRLEGSLFGIFFDPERAIGDPYLGMFLTGPQHAG